jgi:hypothetical protein
MRLVRPLLFVAAMLAAVLLPAGSALALSFPVTNLADSGAGSLRGSIAEANAHIGFDSIPISATGAVKLATQLPTINDDVTIIGPGADSLAVERSAADPFRVLGINSADVTLSGITVRGGEDTAGAGILNNGGELTLTRVVVTDNETVLDGGFAGGGGILSMGPLTLRESFVHDNRVIGGNAGGKALAAGGGIEATSPLTIERSTISGNEVEAIGGGDSEAEAEGGGLLATGTLTIKESTISGNSAEAIEGEGVSVAKGGGIQANGVSLIGSTVTRNLAATDGAGATIEFAAGANLQVGAASKPRNSIIAEPRGDSPSCANPPGSGSLDLDSGGFNLDEDGSCGLGKATDLNSVIAGLEPLAKNGGPTPTHALRADSSALDRGSSFGMGVDQRGLPRPSDFVSISNTEGGDGSDIGAFELQVPPPPAVSGGPVLVSEQPADRQPPNTRIVKGPARSTYETKAKFRFASTEAQSSFQCKLDKGRWQGCRNPYKRTVKPGKHVFKVRAIDRFGNVDPTPARFGWQVKPLGG